METGNRVVVVTGGSGGIGLEIVRRFVGAGDRVVILDRDRESLDAVARDSGLHPNLVTTVEVDVADEQSVHDGVDRAGLDHVDVLVNAAAVIARVDVLEMPASQWRAVLDVNLTGAFIVTQAMVPLMHDGGTVVNIASINGVRHNPNIVAYGVSKAGLVALTQGLAVALGARQIRVNAVVGGHVLTDFSRSRLEVAEVRDKVIGSIPLGRLGTPDDFARAVEFLAGPGSSWITGASINVDGGWLAADSTSIPTS